MDLPSGVERRSGPWTLAVLVALLLAAGCGPAGRPRGPVIVGAREAPQLASAVHFRSWVLPLDPQRVSAPRGPMEFWEAVAAEVRRQGGVVEAPRNPPKPVRDLIAILDTPEQALRANRLVLRRRGRDRRGADPATCELTLEGRSTDIREAHAAPVQSSGTEPFTQRFKEEILLAPPAQPGTAVSLWSLEGNVRRLDRGKTLTLADLASIFPGTAGRLGPPSAPLLAVNGTNIEQRETDLGTIVFGATRARASVVLWRDVATKTPLAADFELAEKLPEFWAQPPSEANSVRATMAALQVNARAWLGSTPARADVVYGSPPAAR